nr:transglutaminase domain-containing protein [uncultured Oscillibacter sp.]
MKETVRGFFTGREGTSRVWPVLLMICAVLVTVGYSAKAGNAEETPSPEPNPIEEAEPPASPEMEEPAEEPLPPEEAQTPEDAGEETPDAEETPAPEETPSTEEAPKAGEAPPGNSAGTKALSASFTQEGLDELVQQAIDNIITPGMTRLEQAKAVWKFAKNGISYTGKSDKSDWRSGAYEGLRTRRGDCFTYYAVSRALLTALGIDNLEVQRVGGPTSHYWNLVNCGDGWYHFDATPRSSKMPYFVSFMFTDQEAADYTARAGRNYYNFDGSLYPERAGGAKEEPAKPADPAPETPPVEDPAPEAPPAEDPVPEAPPAEDPVPEAPPAEEPDPEAPPAEEPDPEAPPAEEPAPETPPAEEPPVDVVELPPAAEAE